MVCLYPLAGVVATRRLAFAEPFLHQSRRRSIYRGRQLGHESAVQRKAQLERVARRLAESLGREVVQVGWNGNAGRVNRSNGFVIVPA
jgi:hypothetical protein